MISSDPGWSHERIAEGHGLPFTVLSDEGGGVGELCRVPNVFGLFVLARFTYVIDEEGVVRHVFSQPKVSRHGEEALGALRAIKA